MKKIFLTLFGLIVSMCVYGQSNLSVMDISITPKIILDSLSGLQSDITIAKMYVSFKINHVEQAGKAYILYGTSQNQGDIRTVIDD